MIDLSQRKEGAWDAAEAEKYLVREGDFLVARGNGSLDLVGRGALVTALTEPVAYPDTMIRIRPNSDLLDPRFLALAWNAPGTRTQIEDMARTTAGIYKVNQTHLESVELPVPPLDEQFRIIGLLEEHLSRLNEAQCGLAKTRRRLVTLERSVLDAHFGVKGSSVPLGHLIADVSAGRSFGASNAPAQDDEWGIIKVSAMTWGAFNPKENKAVTSSLIDPRFEIHEGDLLVSRANTSEYVGSSVLVGPVRPRLLLSDKSLRLSPEHGVRAEWLWRALQAPSARKQISALATGTKDSMRNISQASLLRVVLPEVGEVEQARAVEEFALTNQAMRRLVHEVEATEARLRHLRRALLAAAFSGRLTGFASALSGAVETIDA